MRSPSGFLVCAMLVGAVSCDRRDSTPITASPEEDRQIATALVRNIVDSFNRKDGEAYGENYWPDADLVGFDGAIFDGRAAIVRNHVEMWSGALKDARIDGGIRKLLRLSRSVMIVDVDLANETGNQPAGPARIKFVIQKRGAEWKVISAQNTLSSKEGNR